MLIKRGDRNQTYAQLMSDSNAVPEVLKRIMATAEPKLWSLGSWLRHEETPDDRAALTHLDSWLGYPAGGQMPLFLAGWDERSMWGFDPQDDAYFAQLWRNGSQNEHPDIWICGRGPFEGREFVLTTTHLLAREIAAATGLRLSLVCTAMTGGHLHVSSDIPQPGKPADPPISLKDELGEQGWF